MNNDVLKTIRRSNLVRGVAYCAGCLVIGYAIKVTKSAKPLWALLLLAAPSAFSFKTSTQTETEDTKENNDESES